MKSSMRRAVPAALVVLGLLFGLDARADEPEPTVQVRDDGTIIAEVLLPADEASVRAVLADPRQTASLTPDVLGARAQAAQNDCVDITRQTRGVFRALEIRSRRCPTAHGWREQLVESEDFNSYELEWELSPSNGGTRVVYRFRTEVNIAVPTSIIQSQAARSARMTLLELARRVLTGQTAR